MPVIHLTGNNIGDLHYIWRGDTQDTDVTIFERSLAVVETLQHSFPKYSTHAVRRAMFIKFGRVSSGVKPHFESCITKHISPEMKIEIKILTTYSNIQRV